MKFKKSVAAAALFFSALTVLIVYAQTRSRTFAAAADDFPRGALVYAQAADLPALVKIWNESKFKENYLSSANFTSFQFNHLGRKLESRRREFGDAAGFEIDLEALCSLTGNQASIALYDVGKLEFIFIAPVSEELFAATHFFRERQNFSEETQSDGTIIYRADVAADRGRQKQQLLFTHKSGRFIIATSQKLLAQTLSNITNEKAGNANRLSNDPAFKLLAAKIEPHQATVWLDQKRLNEDYYFKRYWLMSDAADLKNFRAAVFDFEMREGQIIERRKFLLEQATEQRPVAETRAAEMLSVLPANIPFYRLQNGREKTLDEALKKTVFARRSDDAKPAGEHDSNEIYLSDEDYGANYYESLGENFDRAIDDALEQTKAPARAEFEVDFSKILSAARPQAILTFTEPTAAPAPLFTNFGRAAVVDLAAPDGFDQAAFEAAIARRFEAQLMIETAGHLAKWETKTNGGAARRELNLPLTNWNVSYARRGNLLILADNAELLGRILEASNKPRPRAESFAAKNFNSLTVINLSEKENAYERVFDELKTRKLADDFFTENVSSLLGALAEIEKIEIRESGAGIFLDEEIVFHLAKAESQPQENRAEE